ncbi:MAG: methylmalonyl-CoA mutase family protein, partial [Acidimicrobiia bacterium]
ELGLVGMVRDMIGRSDFERGELGEGTADLLARLGKRDRSAVALMISAAENFRDKYPDVFEEVARMAGGSSAPVVGFSGTGGSGKSSLTDEMVRRFLADFPELSVAIVSVDPSRRRSGGALLGDRIRMNSIPHPRAYMRSLATREASAALSTHVGTAVEVVKAAGFDLVIVETSGIGQSDTGIVDLVDVPVYVMTPEYGAATQLEKIDMLDFASLVAVNKADKAGAADALREVRKQVRRNRVAFEADDAELGVWPTIASDFNDPGTNRFYLELMRAVDAVAVGDGDGAVGNFRSTLDLVTGIEAKSHVVPPERVRYLAEIVETIGDYDDWAEAQADLAEHAYRLAGAAEVVDGEGVAAAAEEAAVQLATGVRAGLDGWDAMVGAYAGDELSYEVRGSEVRVPLTHETLSHTRVPKVATPRFSSWGDRVRWLCQENLPGRFPYTAGIYPLKRTAEDPTRMFAGEGPPEQTNRRFHYLAAGMSSKRLSTAFDSVTLYGEDPAVRPDIFGKVGNSGVSVASLDDAKKLYSGFDLSDRQTSVSMTINGPAPIILAFFMNAAVDQACEKHIRSRGLEAEVEAKIAALYRDQPPPVYHGDLPEGHDGLGLMLLGVTGDQVLDPATYGRIRTETLRKVRGTVQADILKEDQAQNTCIFSTEFALKMMGDVQQFFIDNQVRNFYSVSISGYHMAEAGANPITQLAFTLANGFTYVEYYLARGMDIDDFAPNLSFFFSNGIDAEYAVIGRVARRIWAKAMKHKYAANPRSQMLKYHIQTSGRSLHAQEIGFNDIRTTLQALYAIYDNTNSLHTNAYDEAITTPTEESVRRAVAIQLIINKELGLARNENPLQGSFIIDQLTDLVEEAVLTEFDRISSRGGVLGAMERQYQRTKIQEESLYYEQRKESGDYPIIGVNTYLSDQGSPFVIPDNLVRSTADDKNRQIDNVANQQAHYSDATPLALQQLADAATAGHNTFQTLLETTKIATLGQITHTLYQVGGQYRRNM